MHCNEIISIPGEVQAWLLKQVFRLLLGGEESDEEEDEVADDGEGTHAPHSQSQDPVTDQVLAGVKLVRLAVTGQLRERERVSQLGGGGGGLVWGGVGGYKPAKEREG